MIVKFNLKYYDKLNSIIQDIKDLNLKKNILYDEKYNDYSVLNNKYL